MISAAAAGHGLITIAAETIWRKTNGAFINLKGQGAMHRVDKLYNQIINILQDDFPVNTKPFQIIAEKLQISEDELLNRIRILQKCGLIRRIGGIMDSRKLGFYSTLCACKVEQDRLEEVASIINLQKQVTHNYIRDHELNMWFTLTVSSPEELLTVIRYIEKLTGIKIVSMPATKLYKIKVSFEMGNKDDL
jgi:DNA-binding Lrp family transcriptional regulator